MARLGLRGIAKRFGTTVALADAHFDIGEGEIVALLGPNGAGKTTLLECIAGLQAPDAGSVMLDGVALTDALRAREILYLPDGITPWRAQPADWLLRFTAALFGLDSAHAEDVRETLLLDQIGSQTVGTLSKGQRKRLLLAIALRSTRPLLVLDEPFDGLDVRLTRSTIALFRRVAASGRSLVLSIHAMSDAARVADRLVLLSDGRTIGEGTLEALRGRAALPQGTLEDVFLALG